MHQTVEVTARPPDCSVAWETAATEVATGEQTYSVTLTQGTTRAIRSVSVYCAAATAGMTYQPNRGTTGAPVALTTDAIYYNALPSITFEELRFTEDNLVMVVNTGHADTQNVYVVVEYYYK